MKTDSQRQPRDFVAPRGIDVKVPGRFRVSGPEVIAKLGVSCFDPKIFFQDCSVYDNIRRAGRLLGPGRDQRPITKVISSACSRHPNKVYLGNRKANCPVRSTREH